MFDKAVMDYLSENNHIVKREMNKIDFTTGDKKYTAQEALSAVKDGLFREYYGNK
jgi:hypothetical protein